MGYFFQSDEQPADAVRRIAREEIAQAVAEIDDTSGNLATRIHRVRKRLKRVRALLRLVKGPLGKSFAEENEWHRDAARRLASSRDADVMLQALRGLLERHPDAAFQEIAESLESSLQRRRNLAIEEQDDHGGLAQVREELLEAIERVETWPLDSLDQEAIFAGAAKVYARGRKAFAAAHKEPSDEGLHEWRKRVKDHWHHQQLLKHADQRWIKSRCERLEALSNALGDDHDLAVLSGLVHESCGEPAKGAEGQAFLHLIVRQRKKLQRRAWALGEKLFAKKPKPLARRLKKSWQSRAAEASAV